MKTNKVKVHIDIRDVRYVPNVNTSSRVFVDKKTKLKSRRELNKMCKNFD